MYEICSAVRVSMPTPMDLSLMLAISESISAGTAWTELSIFSKFLTMWTSPSAWVAKLMSMISVLPEFMCRQTEEQIFAMVIGHTTTWFSNENLGGEQPRDAKGNCLYYQDTNPYWVDMREAMDRFTLSYDYTHLSTFYADLVEYIVMTVRLYFFIREKQFRPIDRGKYDELVGVKAALPTPA